MAGQTISPDLDQALQHALAQHRAGRLDEAEALYRQLLEAAPRHADALHLLGVIHRQRGRPEQAVTLMREAIAANPAHPSYYSNLGLALADLGRLDEAVAATRLAIARKPDYTEAYFNLGNALKAQGQYSAAVRAYREALALQPGHAQARLNLGVALDEQEQHAEAVANYRAAIALQPDFAAAHFNLGNALRALDLPAAAIASYVHALALRPDYAEAYYNLGFTLESRLELDAAAACYSQAVALKPDFSAAWGNLLFCLNYHPDLSAEEIFAAYRRWNEVVARPLLQTPQQPWNSDPERRLRIGYVSPDLRQHSSRHFVEPLLGGHDKSRHEIYAYSQGVEDAVSERLKTHIDVWRSTVGLDDEAVAQRIRADRIDILVDLAGHNVGNRLLVFARKPAPLQLSYLGYGCTSGLRAIDYYLADARMAPAGCEHLFSEELLRLPVFAVYRPAEGMGEPGPLPALSRGGVTFGSLTRALRINHRVLRCWAELLRRLPGSRLLLNSGDFRSAALRALVTARFVALGVGEERLVLGYDSPPWDLLRQIDIGLDCFPHNSGTTLFESLYMGVPFVTLAGRASVGRIGAAVLGALGREEWIAANEDEYLRIATGLAADVEALAKLRATLRRQMQASLLMNEAAFARSVEDAYRDIWQRRCLGQTT